MLAKPLRHVVSSPQLSQSGSQPQALVFNQPPYIYRLQSSSPSQFLFTWTSGGSTTIFQQPDSLPQRTDSRLSKSTEASPYHSPCCAAVPGTKPCIKLARSHRALIGTRNTCGQAFCWSWNLQTAHTLTYPPIPYTCVCTTLLCVMSKKHGKYPWPRAMATSGSTLLILN